jgi:phage repressor protein C with HTH and peptisase S24 domain
MTGVIEPGDIIFVDTAEKPANNKIVVVNIDGNLLVKRFVQENEASGCIRTILRSNQ